MVLENTKLMSERAGAKQSGDFPGRLGSVPCLQLQDQANSKCQARLMAAEVQWLLNNIIATHGYCKSHDPSSAACWLRLMDMLFLMTGDYQRRLPARNAQDRPDTVPIAV